MLVTKLKHIDRELAMTSALRKAFDFLNNGKLADLPDGRVDIDGERVFALVQRYMTEISNEPKFEHHRKYVDVQFIVSGEETIGWAAQESMTVTETYDAGKDVCFGSAAKGVWTPVRLQAGQLAVLWPDDSHAPKLASGAPTQVMKIVVKVAV